MLDKPDQRGGENQKFRVISQSDVPLAAGAVHIRALGTACEEAGRVAYWVISTSMSTSIKQEDQMKIFRSSQTKRLFLFMSAVTFAACDAGPTSEEDPALEEPAAEQSFSLCEGCVISGVPQEQTIVNYALRGVTSGGRQIGGELGAQYNKKGSGYGFYNAVEGGGYASVLKKPDAYTVLVRTSAGSGTNPKAGVYFESFDTKMGPDGALEGTFTLPQTSESGTYKATIIKVKKVRAF